MSQIRTATNQRGGAGMKPWIKFSLIILLAGSLAGTLFAQQPIAGVSVTSPANESSGPYTTPVNLAATGTGVPPFSFVFFVNGISLQSGTVWRPPQPGSYFISATVTDAAGN